MDKRKREKEVGLRDILQELKEQALVNKKQIIVNMIFSAYIVFFFTIAIFVYDVSKNYILALVLGIIVFGIIIGFVVLKNKLH
jgi:hypothetical protein